MPAFAANAMQPAASNIALNVFFCFFILSFPFMVSSRLPRLRQLCRVNSMPPTAALSTPALIVSSHQLFRGQAHPSCETNFHQRYSAASFPCFSCQLRLLAVNSVRIHWLLATRASPDGVVSFNNSSALS